MGGRLSGWLVGSRLVVVRRRDDGLEQRSWWTELGRVLILEGGLGEVRTLWMLLGIVVGEVLGVCVLEPWIGIGLHDWTVVGVHVGGVGAPGVGLRRRVPSLGWRGLERGGTLLAAETVGSGGGIGVLANGAGPGHGDVAQVTEMIGNSDSVGFVGVVGFEEKVVLDEGLVVEKLGLVLSKLENGFGVGSEFAEFAVLSGFGSWTGNG